MIPMTKAMIGYNYYKSYILPNCTKIPLSAEYKNESGR